MPVSVEHFRSGFVAVIGRPNVGKSTLINSLLGQKIAAVSPRPQTTRRRQLGILTQSNAQIIFTDTPGIHKPIHKLGEYMNQIAMDSLKNADLILWLLDASDSPTDEDRLIAEKLKKVKHLPEIILAINKIDRSNPKTINANRKAFQALYPTATMMEISALRGDALPELVTKIVGMLPETPPLFDLDMVTDLFERDIVADLVREAALKELRDEIPHGLAVRVEEYKERSESLIYIAATLLIEKESHKAIVIGKDGSMLKRIGSLARSEIENMNGRKIYLELHVKVMKNWRDNEQILKQLGYTPDLEK
jgi:GTP-binding protein Era